MLIRLPFQVLSSVIHSLDLPSLTSLILGIDTFWDTRSATFSSIVSNLCNIRLTITFCVFYQSKYILAAQNPEFNKYFCFLACLLQMFRSLMEHSLLVVIHVKVLVGHPLFLILLFQILFLIQVLLHFLFISLVSLNLKNQISTHL